MLIKKDQSIEKKIASDSFVWEYQFNNKNLGVIKAKINGRYPDSGRTINKVCQEVYCVVSGSGKIYVENDEFELNQGDCFLIESGKKYYVVGKDLVMFCPTQPDWYPEQHEFIEDTH